MEFKDYLQGLGLGTFISYDLETTGLDPVSDYIIEFGAVKVVDGVPTERMQQFVKPPIPIPEFITRLTGITDKMVANAPELEEVFDDIYDFLGDWPLVAHNIQFDFAFLQEKRTHVDGYPLKNQLVDTLSLSRVFRYDTINHRLATVADFYGISREGAHRADYDADLVADILLNLVSEMNRVGEDELKTLVAVLKGTELPNRELYINALNWLISGKEPIPRPDWHPQPFQKKPNIRHSENGKSAFLLDDIFKTDGFLSQKLDGYEPRQAQIDMAADTQQIMQDDEFLLAEAGTGVGKSLAYSVPAILARKQIGEDAPLVISCNTKNLQDQLFHKEIPFIQNELGMDLRAILLKGRANYLCKTKWQHAIRDLDWRFTDRDREALQSLVVWARETQTGDIDEHNGFSTAGNALLWSKLCSEPGFCTTPICASNEHCYLGRIRQESGKADLVVINHSLLLADAAAGHAILPPYERLIVDEAHLLEKSAYQYFAGEFSYKQLRYVLDQLFYRGRKKTGLSIELRHMLVPLDENEKSALMTEVNDLEDKIEDCRKALKEFFDEFRETRASQLQHATFTFKELYKAEDDVFGPVQGTWYQLLSELGVLGDITRRVIKQLEALPEASLSRLGEMQKRFEGYLDNLKGTIGLMESQAKADDETMIYWFEIIPRQNDPQIRFFQVALAVGEQIVSEVFEDLSSLILTSGTLSVDGSFDYVVKRLGLMGNDRLTTKDYPSPFYYEDQARIFVPTYLGSQNASTYTGRVLNALDGIWKEHPVGTMILFTSYTMLLSWQEELEERYKFSSRQILVQSNRASRADLIHQFRNTPGSILLATDSFWQGVDIPGEALQLLVIAKLPFQVPSEPIVKANSEALRAAGENDFMGYSVPEAAIKYKQGVGRLIRTTSDFGAIISLDDRIFTKRYGDYFRNSTPIPHVPAPNENELVEGIRAWYRTHGL